MEKYRLSVISMICLLFLSSYFSEIQDFGGDASRITIGNRQRSILIVDASGGGDYIHIQDAIDNANDRDTVYVKAGTYPEILVIDKTINLFGSGRSNTTINGRIRVLSDSVNIRGFHINSDTGTIGINVYHSNQTFISDCSSTTLLFQYCLICS